MNLKRNIRWKSEAVPQKRTFLDNGVVNAMDRNKIVILMVVRIICIVKISLGYIRLC